MRNKLRRGILAAVLALSVCSTGALAAAPQNSEVLGHCNVYSKSVCADGNGDGVCDIHGTQCRRYGHHSTKRHHMCRRPGASLCHFTADGSWVSCADADCNGLCDTCGRAFPVTAGNGNGTYGSAGNGGNSYGSSGTSGNGGSSYGDAGSAGNGGGSYGTGSAGSGSGSYGNYGSGYYGGGYCGSSGHHSSGHHGGHGGHC